MPHKPAPNHAKTLWPMLLLVLITASVFGQVIHYDFVNFDDDGYIYNNHQVRAGVSIKGIIYAFTTMNKGNWIPLSWLSHMLDVEIFGLNPGGHHLTNLLLHIANSLLVFLFLKTNTRKVYSSLIVAMLFAIHPLHVESVAWISERKDVLSAFFGLSALILYSGYVRRGALKNYCLALFLFLCSLLSKPMLVTLPVIMMLIDVWPLQRIPLSRVYGHFKENRILITEKIPFFLLSVIFSLAAIWSQKAGGAMAGTGYPFLTRVMNASVSYSAYLYKTLWPFDLAIIYPYQKDIAVFDAAVSGLLLLFLSGIVIFFHKKHPYLLVGWLWFLITLLPVIGLIQVGTQSMADRYTYIPLIGLFTGIVWGLNRLTMRFRLSHGMVVTLIVFFMLTFSAIAWIQVKTWKNSMTLFEQALSVTHKNWVAHLNLGEALFEHKRVDEAIAHYRQALEINPAFELAYLNMGTALASQGRIDDSIACYQQALEIKKNLPVAWLNLGNAYYRKGMIDEALLHYYKALEFQPDLPAAYCGIGAALVKKGEPLKAINAFNKALEIDPQAYYVEENLKQVEKILNRDQRQNRH